MLENEVRGESRSEQGWKGPRDEGCPVYISFSDKVCEVRRLVVGLRVVEYTLIYFIQVSPVGRSARRVRLSCSVPVVPVDCRGAGVAKKNICNTCMRRHKKLSRHSSCPRRTGRTVGKK